jgi:phosphatidylinositol alpha-1,6-mannosyltransferase
VLPRYGTTSPDELPDKIRQRAPLTGKAEFLAAALSEIRGAPEIVFCSHLFLAPLAAAVAALSGAKLIIHLHGVEIWRTPTYLQRRALETAHALWCVSRDTRARALSHANIAPERAIVVNNSVRADFVPGDGIAARARFGVKDEYVLLTVGRLDARERYKGHDRVIAALPQLRATGLQALYLIAGEGGDRSRLADLARRHDVQKEVRFMGAVSSTDLPDLYRAADLFVMPSTGEGFGIAFLEAMACGTPAIGLSVGGACDALADGELGACVSEPQFHETLARTIQSAPPDAQKLSASVRDRFGRHALNTRVANALMLLN